MKILCYHRVCEAPTDAQELNVSPKNFQAQMEYVAAHHKVVRLEDWQKAGENDVAITFDDGYACVYANALPILCRLGFVFTIFIAPAFLDSPYGYFWDELECLLYRIAQYPLQEYREVCAALRDKSVSAREETLTKLFAVRKKARGIVPEHKVCNLSQLIAMCHFPLVSVGAHTMNHVLLGAMPKEVQAKEIQDSKAFLEKVLDRKIGLFCYPYGGPESFNETTKQLLRENGLEAATTTIKGTVAKDTDAFALPRVLVRDWNVTQFSKETQL